MINQLKLAAFALPLSVYPGIAQMTGIVLQNWGAQSIITAQKKIERKK